MKAAVFHDFSDITSLKLEAQYQRQYCDDNAPVSRLSLSILHIQGRALADAALRMLVHSDINATQENTANWTAPSQKALSHLDIQARHSHHCHRTATRNRRRSRYGAAREHSPRPENLRQSSGQCGGRLVIACVARWQDAVTVHCAIPWARHVASYPHVRCCIKLRGRARLVPPSRRPQSSPSSFLSRKEYSPLALQHLLNDPLVPSSPRRTSL